ncbi:MAG: BREX-2 system adenine-specific DNA-methyltransferase PglX, partial [Candidatus Nanopelagicales bacterium]
FILDQTLTPALAEFGLAGLRLIDPTCGSGHFLLGAFARLTTAWQEHAPNLDPRSRVQNALDAIHGVDLNPFAVAIARFRLTVAALNASGETTLTDAPAFDYHLAIGDSLLGAQGKQQELNLTGEADEPFEYAGEDLRDYQGILTPGTYHVVVGNPPYITPKDKAANDAYRSAYPDVCHRQYALSVPFMDLFFRLAIRGAPDAPAGFVGQITSNSFMKREFGAKVIESLLSGDGGPDPSQPNPVDLLDVIDTSGAYIPGHGTPTVILVGRRRRPVAATVRAVLGVRGEPGQPDNPATGLVWTEIVEHIDAPGFDGTYVTVTDLDRAVLKLHPWSLSGGGAGDLMGAMSAASTGALGYRVRTIGRITHTGADEVYFAPPGAWARHRLDPASWVPLVEGDVIRDYSLAPETEALFPYDNDYEPSLNDIGVARHLWAHRALLAARREPGGTHEEVGLVWYEWSRWHPERFVIPLGIAFAFVATHNHFVLDRGGKVFKQTAPVIKLPAGASEDDHLGLLGVLNSSAACFWLKQVSHDKGNRGGERSTARWDWENFYEFTGTKLQEFPLPRVLPLAFGRALDSLARSLAAVMPSGVCGAGAPTRARLAEAQREHARIRARMVALQEELDWFTYHSYGLIDESLTMSSLGDVPGIALGQRAFEVVLARRVAAGDEETAWFARHGSVPITVLPVDWPDDYRALVRRRLDAIASNPAIRLLERPEFKRRWASESWDAMVTKSVGAWMLDRLEDPGLWSDVAGPRVASVAQLATAVRHDTGLIEAARILTGVQDPDLQAVLAPLVADQAVPYLAAHRYTESGLRKRAEWEAVWALQRREDAGEKVTIPVPPKYTHSDFARQSFWSARGKLDVPKERFISYPGAEAGADASLVVGWAGWDHAEQARALARLLVERTRDEGWAAEQQTPLLAGLVELEPWLAQWHNTPEPPFPTSPADAIRGLLDARLAAVSLTRADVARWRPSAPPRARRRRGV